MSTINIKTQKELYNKVKPALRCKKNLLVNEGIVIVNEDDIWDYNKNYKWKNIKGLTLAEVVDDILNTPGFEYQAYVLNKLINKSDVI